jgi:segregation and condensation protein B
MSKKSRRKQSDPASENPSADPADPVPGMETEPVSEGEGSGAFAEAPGEFVESAESPESAGEETPGEESGDPAGELPASVPGEALAGEVPADMAPSLPLVLEAILFASQKAVTPKELTTHLRNAAAAEPSSPAAAYARIREPEVAAALIDLQAEVAAAGRAYQVRETATGWILSSGPGFAPWLRALYPEAKPTRLSPSALETLAIIAYRQPITRADMEAVRGVSVDGVMQTLLDRGLVKIAGRAEIAGRPLLYATTQFFLDHFGLRNLDELPNAAELRTIPLPRAEQAAKGEEQAGEAPATGELPLKESEIASPAPDEGSGAPVPSPGGEEIVEVTEIIEVRESVVFEEIEGLEEESPADDPRETADPSAGEESAGETPAAP